MPIYLACGPGEHAAALTPPYAQALLGFRLAADYPSLLAPDFPVGATQRFMVLQDDVLPPYEATPALAQMIVDLCAESFGGLVCDFDKPQTPFWQTLAAQLDTLAVKRALPLLVPEQYAQTAPHGLVMLSPGVPQEGFCTWLQAAVARYAGKAVLQMQPIRQELTLPCPTGAGTALRCEQLQALFAEHSPAVFRDDALVCEYFGFLQEHALHLVLFDSAQTLAQKALLAEQAGCGCAIGLYQELKGMMK